MVVQRERGFSREDYARFHPSGSLGRGLMTVDEVMRRGDALPLAPEGSTVREVILTMSRTEGRPGAALIVGGDGLLRGIFTDGDLQFDLGELELLVERIDGADVVCGYRIKRRDPPHRLLNAFLWNRLVRLRLGLKIRDVNCAFKLFRRSALSKIGKLETDDTTTTTATSQAPTTTAAPTTTTEAPAPPPEEPEE